MGNCFLVGTLLGMRCGYLRCGHVLNSGIGIVSGRDRRVSSSLLNESQRLIVDKRKLPSLLQGVINDRNGIPLIGVTGSEVRLARSD